MEGLAWVFASQERRPVDGCSPVRLGWTAGRRRIPLGLRLWRRGGPAKDGLALAWLSDARNRLRWRPASVLFDAWDPSRRLLKRLRDDGWSCVCRLKQHRRCNGPALRTARRPPDWRARGWWTGGLQVLVVRDGAKDDATHRLTLAAPEVRRLEAFRAQSEEVIRVGKEQRGLAGCQARSARAQRHHMACGLTAFCVPEHERHERNRRIYKLKRLLRLRGRLLALPALERLRSAA
jgi:hypothetical protein